MLSSPTENHCRFSLLRSHRHIVTRYMWSFVSAFFFTFHSSLKTVRILSFLSPFSSKKFSFAFIHVSSVYISFLAYLFQTTIKPSCNLVSKTLHPDRIDSSQLILNQLISS